MKKQMSKLLMLFFLLSTGTVFAQVRQVSGNVTDQDGVGAVAATVKVTGTNIGTVTDVDGNFIIEVPENAETLTISYVGMEPKVVPISEIMNVSLESDTLIEGVVVTALGQEKDKAALGYSVGQVSTEEIQRTNTTNLGSGLAGKVPGLRAFSTSGAVGASADLRIRGASTFGSNQPLIVVDGVPISNDKFQTQGTLGGVAQSNRLIDIDPNNIESVSVLKGAGATALYGTRGANGVILITTKSGKGQGVGVTVKTNLTISNVNKLPDFQTKYSQGLNGAYSSNIRSWGADVSTLSLDSNGNIVPVNDPSATGAAVPVYNNAEDFFTTGIKQDYYVALGGATENGNFNLSLSRLNDTGIVPTTFFKRNNVSLKGERKLTDRFTASGSITYSESDSRRAQQGSNGGGVALALYRTPATFSSNGGFGAKDVNAYKNPDGSQRNWTPAFNNPYWTVNEDPYTDNVSRVLGYAKLSYDFADFAKVNYRVGVDNYRDDRQQLFAIGSSNGGRVGQVLLDDYTGREINSDFFVTGDVNVANKVGFGYLLGNNINQRSLDNKTIDGTELSIDGFYNLSSVSNVTTTQEQRKRRNAAFYASLDFDYDDLVYLTLTGRQEWASTFGRKADASFFYPSASLSVLVGDIVELNNLDFAKIRASYGRTASEPDLYKNIPVSYTGNTGINAFDDGYTRGDGISGPFRGLPILTLSNSIGNESLKPETNDAFELGVELTMFGGKLGFEGSYFNQKAKDVLVDVPISTASGAEETTQNIAELTTDGIELMLSSTPVQTEDITWSLGVNFSNPKTMVDKLGVENIGLGGFFGANGRIVEGQQFGLLYGDLFARDDNGNLIIEQNPASPDYGKPLTDYEVGVVGNPNPDYIMGFNNSLQYKNFSLTAFAELNQGGQMWNGTNGALVSYGTSGLTANRGETKVFSGVQGTRNSANEIVVTGGTNSVEAVLDESWYRTGNGSGFVGPSEQYIEDASYFKVREITLGYSLPKAFLEKGPMRDLTFNISGNNLILITDYSGIDPESSLTGSGNLQGLDYFQMPNTKGFTFGLNAKF